MLIRPKAYALSYFLLHFVFLSIYLNNLVFVLWDASQLYYDHFTDNILHKINLNLSFFYFQPRFIVAINLDLLWSKTWTWMYSPVYLTFGF